MTRKHYRAIAKIIKQEYVFDDDAAAVYSRPAIADIADRLADYFKQDNSRFDRQKFLDACGIN